jgi:hypothetical protein
MWAERAFERFKLAAQRARAGAHFANAPDGNSVKPGALRKWESDDEAEQRITSTFRSPFLARRRKSQREFATRVNLVP